MFINMYEEKWVEVEGGSILLDWLEKSGEGMLWRGIHFFCPCEGEALLRGQLLRLPWIWGKFFEAISKKAPRCPATITGKTRCRSDG